MEEVNMSESDNAFDRRNFIKTTCAACAGSLLAVTLGCSKKPEKEAGDAPVSESTTESTKVMIAKCGIICTGCEAYIATQNNDQQALAEVAAKWSQQFGGEFTVESVTCDGCQSIDGRLSGYADGICKIRSCALDKNVENCAHCDEYACEKLEEFFQQVPDLKPRLDEIRKSIKA